MRHNKDQLACISYNNKASQGKNKSRPVIDFDKYINDFVCACTISYIMYSLYQHNANRQLRA